MSLYLYQIAARHLHGTCARRIGRACKATPLRVLGTKMDRKGGSQMMGRKEGRSGRIQIEGKKKKKEERDAQKWEMMGLRACRMGNDAKSRCECSIWLIVPLGSRHLEDTLGPGDDDGGEGLPPTGCWVLVPRSVWYGVPVPVDSLLSFYSRSFPPPSLVNRCQLEGVDDHLITWNSGTVGYSLRSAVSRSPVHCSSPSWREGLKTGSRTVGHLDRYVYR